MLQVAEGEFYVDNGGMTLPMRVMLLTASAILPVTVAVASNQILNDGIWNWWWGGIALVLSGAFTATAYRLTRAPVIPESSTVPPRPNHTYDGDHIDFGGSTFNGP
ncbi:hypothetical protein, partial [Nonomuraea sp. bgisy094]|uniref:hypothetical protein n=1 Tax=Nonomuraea sp. bgisy094 TaxID=3413781 RepID=UPI003EBD9764